MQRKYTQLGNLLAIASFAMLLVTQWLHSPLHHLADEVAALQTVKSEVEHAHSHLHEHSHSHSHSHDHEACGSESKRSIESQSAGDHSGCPSPHPHPNSNDECLVCNFLAEHADNHVHGVEVSHSDLVTAVPNSSPLITTTPSEFKLYVRGPPALS